MHNIGLTWQQAATLSAALAVIAIALYQRGTTRTRAMLPFARETAVLSGLYALWQLAGSLSVASTRGAFTRADWIARLERRTHLPSEASIQNAIAGHPLLVQACNVYYATMHFGVLFVFLTWLFVRHREHYRQLRLTLVLVTVACLLIQLVPVAPPRLLPGFTDTARLYGQSVYSLGLAPDQLSAMPSVHVAWAVLIGWYAVRIGTGRWRWLAVGHPIITAYVVMATANHFWLDGIVAVILLVVCAYAQAAARSLHQRLRADPRSLPGTGRLLTSGDRSA